MNHLFKRFLIIILLLLTVLSCGKLNLKKEVPNCIEKKIKQIKNEEVSNPPAQVWEWKTSGKTYYYISSDCCDDYNYLYDDHCNVVCAPDGGITGNGDGKCPDFKNSIQKTLVWKDER